MFLLESSIHVSLGFLGISSQIPLEFFAMKCSWDSLVASGILKKNPSGNFHRFVSKHSCSIYKVFKNSRGNSRIYLRTSFRNLSG